MKFPQTSEKAYMPHNVGAQNLKKSQSFAQRGGSALWQFFTICVKFPERSEAEYDYE